MRRVSVAAAVAAVCLVASPGFAGHTGDGSGCGFSVDLASAANPHAIDQTLDWNGPVLGNGGASFGDLYREGTDIESAWVSRDASGVHANIKVVELLLGERQANSIFYMRWNYPDTDGVLPDRTKRWASANLNAHREVVYEFGYEGPAATPGASGQLFVDGSTTGSIDASTGTVTITLPLAAMGIPATGEWLANLIAESRVLTGSPEPLPPPSPVRRGFVWVTDDTLNGNLACDALL